MLLTATTKNQKETSFFFALFCISEGLFLYNNVQASCYVCIIMYISFIESKAAAIFFRTFWEESPMNFTCIKRFPTTNHSSWHDSFLGHLCSTTIINQREHQPYQHQMPASEHRILSQCPISLAVALSMNGKLVRFKELFQWCPTTKSFRQDSLTFSRNISCDVAILKPLGPMSLQIATIHRWRSSSYLTYTYMYMYTYVHKSM